MIDVTVKPNKSIEQAGTSHYFTVEAWLKAPDALPPGTYRLELIATTLKASAGFHSTTAYTGLTVARRAHPTPG